jgi:hypothetical protein
VCVKHIIHHMVDDARNVVVLFLVGKFGSDFERLLTSIRDYRYAIMCENGREIGGKHLEFVSFLNRVPSTRAYMSGNSTAPDHPLMVDWGHVIGLRACAKWVLQSTEIDKNGLISKAGGICNQRFDCVIGDDQVHDVWALNILGGSTDIQMD